MKLSSGMKNCFFISFLIFSISSYGVAQNSVSVQDPRGFYAEETQASIVDEEVPVALEGIWENSSRYVIFDSGYVSKINGKNIPTMALKMFYGWYLNRAAESDEYTQQHKRNRNDVEAQIPQQLEIHFEPLTWELLPESENTNGTDEQGNVLYAGKEISGAWDMQIKYPGVKDIYHVPVAVIGNKLYLRFKIRNSIPEYTGNDQSDTSINGYWQDQGNASGILISPPYTNTELLSYYVTDSAVYHIRYWQTDMEYDGETEATFSDGNDIYSVPKHLIAGNKVFTCVNGRSRKIRNIEKGSTIPETYNLNSVIVRRTLYDENNQPYYVEQEISTICALGEPYLVLTEGTRTYEEILALAALRKRPPMPPIFPPHGLLDFDWSIIEDPPADYNRRMLDLGK